MRSWRPLTQQKLLTDKPFDQPIEFEYFELWHHWGRTAKFGMWMQGPDYTQWHGAYEIEKALVNLKEIADQILKTAQGEVADDGRPGGCFSGWRAGCAGCR